MEWIKGLSGKTVGLDSAPLIYFVEEHPDYLSFLLPFFEAVERGEIQAVTSIVTLTEVLVHPLRHTNLRLAAEYAEILQDSPNLRSIPVSQRIAADAAGLRAMFRLKTPDAIQLATAQHECAAAFLTNDRKIPAPFGMKVLVLDDILAAQHH